MANIGVMATGLGLRDESTEGGAIARGKKAVPISESRSKIHEKLKTRRGKYMDELEPGYVTTKHLHDQWRWHGMFRDTANMMYRTSYLDHTAAREIACKSTHPAGYGGHVMRLRHDVLFNDTEFDVVEAAMVCDPQREQLPDFAGQLQGLPTTTPNPRGAKKVPTYKTCPVSSVLAMREPWASTGVSAHSVLGYREDVVILPKRRPYELPPLLHPSGAVTERGRPRRKDVLIEKKPEAPAEPELAAPEEAAVFEKPRRKVFVSAPTKLPDAPAAELASTAEVLLSSLVTPRGGTPRKVEDVDRSLGAQRMYMIANTRASYVLNEARPIPRKPSVSPRLPAVSPRATQ